MSETWYNMPVGNVRLPEGGGHSDIEIKIFTDEGKRKVADLERNGVSIINAIDKCLPYIDYIPRRMPITEWYKQKAIIDGYGLDRELKRKQAKNTGNSNKKRASGALQISSYAKGHSNHPKYQQLLTALVAYGASKPEAKHLRNNPELIEPWLKTKTRENARNYHPDLNPKDKERMADLNYACSRIRHLLPMAKARMYDDAFNHVVRR